MSEKEPTMSADAQALFASARRSLDPTANDAARVKGALDAKLMALPAAKPLNPNAQGPAGVGGAIAKPLLGVTLLGGAIALSAAVLHVANGPIATTGAATKAQATAQVSTPREKGSTLEREVLREKTDARQVVAKPIASETAALVRANESNDDMGEQISMLQAIQADLRNGHYRQASASARAYIAKFPKGAFVEECIGAEVIAHCSLDPEQRIVEGEKFLASYPHSSMSARVRAACGAANASKQGTQNEKDDSVTDSSKGGQL